MATIDRETFKACSEAIRVLTAAQAPTGLYGVDPPVEALDAKVAPGWGD